MELNPNSNIYLRKKANKDREVNASTDLQNYTARENYSWKGKGTPQRSKIKGGEGRREWSQKSGPCRWPWRDQKHR